MPHSATLPHLHPSTGRSVKMALKQAKRAQAKHPDVTLDECTAIVLYTMEEIPRETSLYYVLNLALRNKERAAIHPWRDYIWLLLHALRKLPPSTEATVFRGCKKSPADLGIELTKDFEFTWSSFSSTATTQGVMQTFLGQSGPRTLITIKMVESSGRDVRDFSLYPGENEILFPPNMCFEVVDSFDAGNQLIMVQCRQTETVDVILDLNGKRTGSGVVTGKATASKPTPQPPASPAKPMPQPPAQPFKLDERVECRNRDQSWQVGTVVSVAPLEVRPDGVGWTAGYVWDEVRVLSPEADGPPKASAKAAPAPQPPPPQSPASPAKPTPQLPASPAKPMPQPPASPTEPAPKPPPKHTEPWACSACTLINAPHRSTCRACETAAPPPPSIDQPVAPKPAPSYDRPSEQVKNFRGPCADYCKPLAPCCCVSADGEAIFGCVPTDRQYFLPACLHMALCPQLGCDPKGGDEDMDWDYCCRLFFITLLVTPYVCCLQSKVDYGGHLCCWYLPEGFEPAAFRTARLGPRPARPSCAVTAERHPAPHACPARLAALRVCCWDWRCGDSTWNCCPCCPGEPAAKPPLSRQAPIKV